MNHRCVPYSSYEKSKKRNNARRASWNATIVERSRLRPQSRAPIRTPRCLDRVSLDLLSRSICARQATKRRLLQPGNTDDV